MHKSRVIPFGAIALLAAIGSPLRAQAAPAIQLAFGYECGDRFIVRNDGAEPVLVEYATAGTQDRSQLHLRGKQSAEIASAQAGNLELWVGGKVVASEAKGNRPCAGSGNPPTADSAAPPPLAAAQPPNVTQPPDPALPPDSTAKSDSASSAPGVVVYAPPPDYVLNLPNEYDHFYPPQSNAMIGAAGFGGNARGSIGRSTVRSGSGGRAHR
jgi:hypothetical protein